MAAAHFQNLNPKPPDPSSSSNPNAIPSPNPLSQSSNPIAKPSNPSIAPSIKPKSYAQALNNRNLGHVSNNNIINKSLDCIDSNAIDYPLSSYKGEPAIIFSKNQIEKIAQPFKYALIGKFSSGKPSLDVIRKVFSTLNLNSDIQIGLLDTQCILIRLNNERDYHRIWLKENWNIYQFPMRVLKYTSSFNPQKECPLVPVWILFPGLPPHLFDRDALRAIARGVGKPLQVDASTATLIRPSVARVCVEVDLIKPLTKRIWIGCENEGFWQHVIYENVPLYCKTCFKLDHDDKSCGKEVSEDQSFIKRNTYVPNSQIPNRSDASRKVNNAQNQVPQKQNQIPQKQNAQVPNINTNIRNSDYQQQQQWIQVKNRKNKNVHVQVPISSKGKEKFNEFHPQSNNSDQQLNNTTPLSDDPSQALNHNSSHLHEEYSNQKHINPTIDQEDVQQNSPLTQKVIDSSIPNPIHEDDIIVDDSLDVEEGEISQSGVESSHLNPDILIVTDLNATGQDIISSITPKSSSPHKQHNWELDSGFASDGHEHIERVKKQGIGDFTGVNQEFQNFSISLQKTHFFNNQPDPKCSKDTSGTRKVALSSQAFHDSKRMTRSASKIASSQGLSSNLPQ